jgi:REP element-mobilizing transposase RayT
MDHRYGSHTVYQIEYHFVWVTRYRYKVLTVEVRQMGHAGFLSASRYRVGPQSG